MWRLGKMFEPRALLSLGNGGLKKAPRRRAANTRQRALRCEALEDRRMLSAASVLEPFVFPPEPDQLEQSASESTGESPPFPLEETFLLHSLPGASKTVYLDFDGHITTNTLWNVSYGDTITTPAYTLDSNSDFSNSELERIQRVWERVVEDFIPFNVNVTTEDPGVDALKKSGASDNEWGIRVVIGENTWFDDAGGVAYLDSFNWNSDTPTYVFNSGETGVAEAASHEIGHTLGLSHDGRDSINQTYYPGHGSGATGWAPIMGVGYNKELVQWSRGEYPDSDNQQNDLSIMASQNGFSYRADDHGNSSAGASALLVSEAFDISDEGIIERTTDVDYFSFTTGDGQVSFNIKPFYRSPNLDILATLYDSSGEVVATSNPLNQLNATFNLELEQGDYYISIDGTGYVGDGPSGPDYGYSDYSSLGYYSLTGFIVEPILSPIVTVNPLLTNDFTPDLSGTINDPDATILLTVGNQVGLAVTNNGDGTWTLPGSSLTPLSDAIYDVVLTATNLELLQGTDPTTGELTIDSSFVFLDNFVTTEFNTSYWSSTGSTTIDDVGIDEASAPYAARFNGHPVGGDTLTSTVMDLSSATGAEFSYSFQRRGGGDSPEIGEDLVVEFLDSTGNWKELDRQLGSELDMIVFDTVAITLPSSALHSAFQFRIQSSSTLNVNLPFDDWFVDTVGVRATPNDPTVQFSQSAYYVSEGDYESLIVEITRNDTSGVSEVLVSVTGGTATPGSDYTGSTFPVNFAVGETSKLIPITLIDDPEIEPTETIELTLTQVVNSKIGAQGTSILSILDDGLPGDFDRNGVVDLEDEQLWRSTFGNLVAPYVDADGNGNGRIDAADYSVWRDNFVPLNNLDILRTDVAPVIDGSSDAVWQGTDSLPIGFSLGSITSAADLSAQWRVLWDDTALYLYAEVTDDILKLDSLSNVFDDDGVEFFIDPDYSHGGTYDSNDAQWMLRPFSSTAHPGSNTQTNAGEGVVYATSFTGAAYVIEASIPWSALGVSPTAGSQIGIDIAIQDDDDGGNVDYAGVDGRLTWHDQQNIGGQNPSVFGPAILSSQVAVPAASGSSATGSVATGSVSDVALLLDDSSVDPFQVKPQLLDYFALPNDTPPTTPQARLPFLASLGESFARHDHLLLLTSPEVPYAVDQESSLDALDAAFAEDVSDDRVDHEEGLTRSVGRIAQHLGR